MKSLVLFLQVRCCCLKMFLQKSPTAWKLFFEDISLITPVIQREGLPSWLTETLLQGVRAQMLVSLTLRRCRCFQPETNNLNILQIDKKQIFQRSDQPEVGVLVLLNFRQKARLSQFLALSQIIFSNHLVLLK